MPEQPEVWVDYDRKPVKHKPEQCPRCERDMILRHHCGTPVDADDLKERMERAVEMLTVLAHAQKLPEERHRLTDKAAGVTLALSYLHEAIRANGGDA